MDYIELILAVYGVASIIARITPTKKDNEILSKIGKIINFILLSSKNKKPDKLSEIK